MSETAGQRLRRDIDQALAHAVKEHGPMEFDELEQLTIERAVIAADRAEALRRLFDAELAGPQRSSILTRLSAEARQLDRTALEVARTVVGSLGATPKSDRHVRAPSAAAGIARRGMPDDPPTGHGPSQSAVYAWLEREEREEELRCS